MNAFAPIFYVAFFKGRCVSFIYSFFTHFSPLFVSVLYHVNCSTLLAGLLGGLVIMFTSSETIAWRRWAQLHALFVSVYVCVHSCNCVLIKCVICTPQCAPPGCLIELCIQLSMIMLGKQLIQNNVFEVLVPYVYIFLHLKNIHFWQNGIIYQSHSLISCMFLFFQ